MITLTKTKMVFHSRICTSAYYPLDSMALWEPNIAMENHHFVLAKSTQKSAHRSTKIRKKKTPLPHRIHPKVRNFIHEMILPFRSIQETSRWSIFPIISKKMWNPPNFMINPLYKYPIIDGWFPTMCPINSLKFQLKSIRVSFKSIIHPFKNLSLS